MLTSLAINVSCGARVKWNWEEDWKSSRAAGFTLFGHKKNRLKHETC